MTVYAIPRIIHFPPPITCAHSCAFERKNVQLFCLFYLLWFGLEIYMAFAQGIVEIFNIFIASLVKYLKQLLLRLKKYDLKLSVIAMNSFFFALIYGSFFAVSNDFFFSFENIMKNWRWRKRKHRNKLLKLKLVAINHASSMLLIIVETCWRILRNITESFLVNLCEFMTEKIWNWEANRKFSFIFSTQ